jgi:Tat protein secretion system quality control protein TatD with DNase activity
MTKSNAVLKLEVSKLEAPVRIQKIAELKGITYEEVVEQTEKNAREMYRL